MGYIRKEDSDRLRQVLEARYVDDFRAAEDIAEAFLRISYNRNLCVGHWRLVRYVAAGVYLLATRMPVPIVAYHSAGVPVKHRSRLGDVCHLIVLLSHRPATVLDYLRQEPRVWSCCQDALSEGDADGVLSALCDNMDRMIVEDCLKVFTSDAFSFRVSRWTVSPLAKAVRYEAYDLTGLVPKVVLVRCTCDLRASLSGGGDDTAMSLEVLGARLRGLRNRTGLSQKEMASRIGISKIAYLRMESGRQISVDVLFRCLLYHSRTVNLDVFFDKRLWELAQIDRELLYKKVHINSVVHRKVQLLQGAMADELRNARAEISAYRDSLSADDIIDRLDRLESVLRAGTDSVLSLTDDL